MATKSKRAGSKKSIRAKALCPGRKAFLKSEDLSKETFRRLVGRRARRLGKQAVEPVEKESSRKKLEQDISQFYEKVNLGEDFLPAQYLRDGAVRAEAVCRIVTPGSLGTGFLIADGNYIMTNNHVLPNADEAAASNAEFGYEAGTTVQRVALQPGRFFITDERLDFSIVACHAAELAHIKPVPLLRDPATVTRNDRVNIIQHPRGRPKEIAIHENLVTRVKDTVIHYETDTEPGSSGSPVFNNDWELVALHHAGWRESGNRATNEGVRVASIVAKLLGESAHGGREREGLEAILGTIPDSSPYLGFFDYHGVATSGPSEIEVPDFTGTPDFADVGFWNIEHFNAAASDRRIDDVAGVLSRLSMDVMGLTEVHRGALDRLVTAMAGRGDAIGYEYLDVSGSQDIAVIYDRDTSQVKLNETIPLRHKALLESRSAAGKTVFPRLPLFAECQVSEGNSRPLKFIMIVVHLKAFGDAQSRERRRLAALALARIIDDIREVEQLPVVLGGDFNERLDTDVLRALKESPDLFSLTADDASTDAISYVGGSHDSLIDHIMVSNDVRMGDIQGDDAAIVRLDRSVRDFARDVSDHVPVVFRMVQREEPVPVPDGGTSSGGHRLEIPEDASSVELSFH